MEKKYTEGPWVRDWNGYYFNITPFGDNQSLAYVTNNRYLSGDYKANAHLIAAAPELLEALQLLVHYHLCEQEGIGSGQPTSTQWLEAVDKASEAIAKALGTPINLTDPITQSKIEREANNV